MSIKEFPRYKLSGEWSPALLVGTAIAAAIFAPLGIAYQEAVDWVPIIYLNLAVCVFLGFAAGGAAKYLIVTNKCRNRMIAVISAIAIASSALLTSHYWSYTKYRDQLSSDDGGRTLSFNGYYQLRRLIGWRVSNHGSTKDSPQITGYGVDAVWMLEAALVLGFAVSTALAKVNSPFCERCDVWNTEPKTVRSFHADKKIRGASLKSARFVDDVLNQQPDPEPGKTPAVFSYLLSRCPKCGANNYLSIKTTAQTKNWKGQNETKVETLCKNVELTETQAKKLEETSGAQTA